MKKLICLSLLTMITACSGSYEGAYTGSINPLEDKTSISGSAINGTISGNILGFDGNIKGYSDSDIVRLPIKVIINTTDGRTGRYKQSVIEKEYYIDLFLQRSEFIQITKSEFKDYQIHRIFSDSHEHDYCYEIRNSSRSIEVMRLGETQFGCHYDFFLNAE